MNPFRLELESFVEINADRFTVWGVFERVQDWKRWCGVCSRAEVETGFAWLAGQSLRLSFKLAGVNLPFNVRVVQSVPGQSVSWASTVLSVSATRTFTFEYQADGTVKVRDHKLFVSRILPLRLFYPRPVIRRMSESMLTDLKAECERVAGPR